jgi:hypothetical protein
MFCCHFLSNTKILFNPTARQALANHPRGIWPERQERGGPCWLLKMRWVGTQRVQSAGTIDFFLALAALVSPAQNVFVFTVNLSGSASVNHRWGSEDPDPHPDPDLPKCQGSRTLIKTNLFLACLILLSMPSEKTFLASNLFSRSGLRSVASTKQNHHMTFLYDSRHKNIYSEIAK